jgi:Fic family protein
LPGERRIPGTKITSSNEGVIYTPPEGESIIRDKLSNLDRFLHEEDGIDPLIKLAILHYQFEAIHPFSDGNGRTGKIINILFLVQKDLLDIPILFLSHYILRTKSVYLAGLRRVTEEGAWVDWVLYMLDAIEITARETKQRVDRIRNAMDEAQKLVQTKIPKIYSKDLIEVIFEHPYCKARFIEQAGFAKRQTAAEYLKKLQQIGLLKSVKIGREQYYININLVNVLSK